MAKKNHGAGWVVWLRRGIQTAFLLLFLYLFLQTAFHDENRTGGPVTFFFEIDPLVMAAIWLGVHTAPPALLWSLATVAATTFFGRWFCGWVCPFGVVHNAVTSLRRRRVKLKVERGGYTPYQKWKYYILIGFLVGAALGANVVGWLDPFSFFYRSLAVSIYPAADAGLRTFFGWVYDVDPGVGSARATAVTEPVYDFLKEYFLAQEQPHYQWGLLIGVLFIGAAALNLSRPRFWCRYVCPLGALLGVVGKNPLLRLNKDVSSCNDCRLCSADCPGGANPHVTEGWKPAECFFCWNCESVCPHQAIGFRFGAPDAKEQTEPMGIYAKTLE
jgi:polyferredoxin